MFSPKAMVSFEPYMTSAIRIFVNQMDSLINTGKAGRYTAMGGSSTEINRRQRQGEAAFDAAQWAAFLAFDIVSDLVGHSRVAIYYAAAINEWSRLLGNHSDLPPWGKIVTVGSRSSEIAANGVRLWAKCPGSKVRCHLSRHRGL